MQGLCDATHHLMNPRNPYYKAARLTFLDAITFHHFHPTLFVPLVEAVRNESGDSALGTPVCQDLLDCCREMLRQHLTGSCNVEPEFDTDAQADAWAWLESLKAADFVLGTPVYGTGYQDKETLTARIVSGRTLTDWMKQPTNNG